MASRYTCQRIAQDDAVVLPLDHQLISLVQELHRDWRHDVKARATSCPRTSRTTEIS